MIHFVRFIYLIYFILFIRLFNQYFIQSLIYAFQSLIHFVHFIYLIPFIQSFFILLFISFNYLFIHSFYSFVYSCILIYSFIPPFILFISIFSNILFFFRFIHFFFIYLFSASGIYTIVEPFPQDVYPTEFSSVDVTCVASDPSGFSEPVGIKFVKNGNTLKATENLYFTSRVETPGMYSHKRNLTSTS